MIAGVEFKKLVTHTDERGFFRELVRSTDDFFGPQFGQLSHSLVHAGIAKAWHMHKVQYQWTYVMCGVLKVALHDCRRDSSTYRETQEFLVGDNHAAAVYSLPPGVAHGYRCLSGPAHVIYLTSGVYDTSDEVRISHDDPDIGYDWTAMPEIR
jgi:dTDP-4-dehydrorhamnose 3,5-epimerase